MSIILIVVVHIYVKTSNHTCKTCNPLWDNWYTSKMPFKSELQGRRRGVWLYAHINRTLGHDGNVCHLLKLDQSCMNLLISSNGIFRICVFHNMENITFPIKQQTTTTNSCKQILNCAVNNINAEMFMMNCVDVWILFQMHKNKDGSTVGRRQAKLISMW